MSVAWTQVVAVHLKSRGKVGFISEVGLTDLILDCIVDI